jgi:hypothetical protein
VLLVISINLVFLLPATAQELKKLDDAWILYEKGRFLMDKGEWGEALHQLKLAIAKRGGEAKPMQTPLKAEAVKGNTSSLGIFPEAEMAIGDIFKHTEPELARQQYELALQHAAFFYVKEDVYQLLYKQVDLFKNYFTPPRYKEMEERLFLILKEAYTPLPKGKEAYYTSTFTRYEDIYLNTFLQKGFSKVLTLYRIKEQLVAQAHGELADIYFQEGGEKQLLALKHYLFCLTILLTEGIEQLGNYDFTYKYKDLSSFFGQTEKIEAFLIYFKQEELFIYLYRLAATSYVLSQWAIPPRGWQPAVQQLAEQRAREIWQLLAELKAAAKYSEMAKMQLKKPWLEFAFPADD